MGKMRIVCVLIMVLLGGCSLLKKKEGQTGMPTIQEQVRGKQLTPEQSKAALRQTGESWLYGQGIGNTALTIGGVVLFPPYLAVVLGNGILDLSGYEPIGVSTFLPEKAAENWSSGYDQVASMPGRMAAAIAGREYQTKEISRAKMSNITKGDSAKVMASPKIDALLDEDFERR